MADKNSLKFADIIHALGLVILGAGVFLGSNYYFGGNLVFSILTTLTIILLLAGIVYVISVLKKAERDQQTKKLGEIIILILGYGSVAAISFFALAHFVNIEFTQKETLKSELKLDAQKISGVYSEFEVYVEDDVLEPYRREMTTAFRQNNGEQYEVSSLEEIDDRISIQERKLIKSDAFLIGKNKAIESQKSMIEMIENWNPILIPNQVGDIADRIEMEKEWINEKFSSNKLLQDNPFVYDFKKDNLLSNLERFNINEINWFLLVPIFLLLHLMILWPYFATSRHRMSDVKIIKNDESFGAKL